MRESFSFICKYFPRRPLQKAVQRRSQYRALPEKRDAVAFLLAEPEAHNFAVAGAVPRGHDARTVTVAPGGSRTNPEIIRQVGTCKAPKVLALHALNILGLLFAIQVLQAATAATSKKQATRVHAVGARFKNFYGKATRKILF